MFPKHPTAVAVPPEKTYVGEPTKDSTVLYMVDGADQQIDPSRWRTRRATICACAVVLTTLILVAGTLGAITIVLTHTGGPVTAAVEPTRAAQSGKNALPKLPGSNPRIKIDDGGLWPPHRQPVTPDLVAVDDGTDDDITVDDGGDNSGRAPGGGSEVVTNQGDDGLVVEPVPEGPVVDISSVPSSDTSSSQSSPSSDDYNNERNYISSSFPYGGFYMRGEEGEPPSEYTRSSEAGDVGSGGSEVAGSGGSEVVGADEEEEADDEEEAGSGEEPPSSYSPYSDDPSFGGSHSDDSSEGPSSYSLYDDDQSFGGNSSF